MTRKNAFQFWHARDHLRTIFTQVRFVYDLPHQNFPIHSQFSSSESIWIYCYYNLRTSTCLHEINFTVFLNYTSCQRNCDFVFKFNLRFQTRKKSMFAFRQRLEAQTGWRCFSRCIHQMEKLTQTKLTRISSTKCHSFQDSLRNWMSTFAQDKVFSFLRASKI